MATSSLEPTQRSSEEVRHIPGGYGHISEALDSVAFALERIGKRSMRPSIMDPENSFDVFEADGSCMAPAVSYEEACDLCEITPTKE